MNHISSKTEEVAVLPKFRLPLNLQLFAGDDDGTPNLEDSPEFREDAHEFEKSTNMDKKMEKFIADRTPKEPNKEIENKVEKEPAKAEEEAGTKEVATPEKPKQDKETNDAFQEMRKKLEISEKEKSDILAKAIKADALIKAQFGNQGINTVEQYEQWIQQGKEEENEQRYKDMELTPEEIEAIKNYKPLKESAETLTQAQQKTAYEASWEQLYKSYPDVEADIIKFNKGEAQETFNAEMQAEIARGASPLAAYRNVHFEAIIANATKSVKETATQDAVDRLSSKNHIKGNASAAGDIEHFEIDPEQMRIYRGLMKGKTDAEIRKFAKKQNAGG